MTSLSELLDAIHEFNAKIGHDKDWEKLRDRIMSSNASKEYWFKLLDDVEAFFSSNAPEEEKKQLRGYTERLARLLVQKDKNQQR